MSLPRYEKYKDSGVEWLGEVPEGWRISRIKSLLKEPLMYGANEAADGDDPSNPRFVRITDIDGKNDLRNDTFRSLPNDIAQPYLLKDGDVLLARSGATVGKSFIYKNSWGICCFAGYLIRARLNNKAMDANFFFACCQSSFYWQYVSGIQIQATIQNVSAEKYANLWLPLPPLEDQHNIVIFLDHETAKIDALTTEQQKLIELLKEKRQAVISHAVTKGLNPDVKMKDSGIEWLGEVPEHWDRIQLGRLCLKVSDGPHFSPDYVDEGVLFISARNIKVNAWSLDDAKFISENDYSEFCKRIIPEKGDVLYTKGGTTGVAKVVDLDERFQVWVHVAVLKLDRAIATPDYVAYTLNSHGCYEQSQLYTRGATNNDLGLTRMIKIWLALPPIQEQSRIVAKLDNETAQIDSLLGEADKAITLLQERRTALISAAVTGKIDVRGLVEPPQREATP